MPSLPASYFDALYTGNSDPWGFASSDYESAKYAATMAALPRQRYRAGLEVGCSIGVLTAAVASRCDTLLAIDVAEAALASARQRNADCRHVRFERGAFPSDLPAGLPALGFDLLLLSEVLYYLDGAALADAALRTLDLTRPGSDIVLVHWLGPTPDYPLTGEQAANMFISELGPEVELLMHRRWPEYRIDVLRR